MPPIVESPRRESRLLADDAAVVGWTATCLVASADAAKVWRKPSSDEPAREWDLTARGTVWMTRASVDELQALRAIERLSGSGAASAEEEKSRSTRLTDDFLHSRGHAYMRVGAALSMALMIPAVLTVAKLSEPVGLIMLWLAGATFFFCNFAAARLNYPFYIVGPGVAMVASFGCLLLAATVGAAAIFD